MSFTYDLSTDIGKFRLRIWDTNLDDYLFQDEEITALINMFGSITRALIHACYSLHSRYTAGASDEIKVDDITVKDSGKSKAEKYLLLAKQLEDALISGLDPDEYPMPFFGGVYQSDLDSNEDSISNGTIREDPFPTGVFDTFNKNSKKYAD